MYFIMSGEVEVILSNGDSVATLGKGAQLGEMAILSPNPSVRGASARNKTDVSYAVLSLQDFKFIIAQYPEFGSKIRKKAKERNSANTAHGVKPSASALLSSDSSNEEDSSIAPKPADIIEMELMPKK